ncbi:MAG: aldolase/citrate lyase family protein [Desulfobacterales bacterium]
MSLSFREKLLQGETLIGCIQTLPATEVSELLGKIGFDWLFIDLEHSALDIGQAQRIVQGAQSLLSCVIRCPGNDEVWIKKCLDLGVDGIIIPQVKTRAEAQFAVDCGKYPPLGRRSVGLARAQGYGLEFEAYVTQANSRVALVIQIEHIQGVHNIDAILGVAGIDAVFVGPYDLSASLDKTGALGAPEVVEAISTVRAACAKRHIPLGIFGASADAVKPFMTQGYQLIAVGTDALLLGSSARQVLAELRS